MVLSREVTHNYVKTLTDTTPTHTQINKIRGDKLILAKNAPIYLEMRLALLTSGKKDKK